MPRRLIDTDLIHWIGDWLIRKFLLLLWDIFYNIIEHQIEFIFFFFILNTIFFIKSHQFYWKLTMIFVCLFDKWKWCHLNRQIRFNRNKLCIDESVCCWYSLTQCVASCTKTLSPLYISSYNTQARLWSSGWVALRV